MEATRAREPAARNGGALERCVGRRDGCCGRTWLERTAANAGTIQAHMRGLRTLGAPYTDEEIAKAPEEVKGKTEMDAVIAYLQVLGIHRK